MTPLDFGVWKDATYQYVWDNDWNYCVWAVEETRRSTRSSTSLNCFSDWIKKKAALDGVEVKKK